MRIGIKYLFTSLVLLALAGCGVSYKIHPQVVFIGDSITWLWTQSWTGEAPVFQQNNWFNAGVPGQTSGEIAARFQVDALGLQPAVVHILAGTNDVYPGWTLTETSINMEKMVAAAKHNGVRVVIGTIPPWGPGGLSVADPSPQRFQRIDELNAWLIQFAAEQGIQIVDYHSMLVAANGENYIPALTADGVHPSAAGYALMTPAAEKAIAAALAAAP